MVQTYNLELEEGGSVLLTFSNDFLRTVSQLMEDKVKYPIPAEKCIQAALNMLYVSDGKGGDKVNEEGLKPSNFNEFFTYLFPFVLAGLRATKQKNVDRRILNGEAVSEDEKSPVTDDYALAVIRSIKNPVDLGSVIRYTIEAMIPKGLPEDKKKEPPAEKAKGRKPSSGKK